MRAARRFDPRQTGAMKRISYLSEQFITADSIADAIVDYAMTLAIVTAADVIEFPAIDSSGALRDVRMIIGPASQMASVTVDGTFVDIPTDKAVADIRSRNQRRLPPSEPITAAGMPADHPDATELDDPTPPTHD